MKKRKMLISIALITIMLLNCIMPLIPAYADVSGDSIVLNTKLYKAIKNELIQQNVQFTYSDTEKSITIAPEVIATITEMNLNNKSLDDLTGLENFVALERLELSGNNLTKNSNLACLAGLPLKHLDLSTNRLEDVSDIDGLISTMKATNGKAILTSQNVAITKTAVVDTEKELELELPAILEKAGFIKSVWKDENTSGPEITSWVDRVTATNNKITVDISRAGLLKIEIYIYDNPTEAESAANLNKASENDLYQSKFYIYVVVHPEETTAIHVPDANMYKEIKRQLTQGKYGVTPNPNGNIEAAGYTPNRNLSSYPYVIDENGEIMYDECTFETDGENIHLTVVGEADEKYTINNGTVYLYGTSIVYTNVYENTVIYSVDASGNITQKMGYKIPLNSENETLYDNAYDEPQVFVIDDQTLMNKITSLILNNKQIRDIRGIEYFVGLKSDLNLSQNYLSNIDPLYDLQKNKDIYEDKLQEKYNSYLLSKENYNLKEALTETTGFKKAADGNIESIIETVKNVVAKFEEGAQISRRNEEGAIDPNYATALIAKAEEIDNLLKEIYGYVETDPTTGAITREVKGYINELDENLLETSNSLGYAYSVLSTLYDIYNNEYKLLTMLTDTLNYMDIEEYEAFVEERKDTEKAKKLVKDQISILTKFEADDDFTHLEKALIEEYFGIVVDAEEKPLAEAFKDVESPALIDVFRELALYSEMANYCTIKRMENETAQNHCYCAEYLKNRIKEFEYEGIPTDLEEKLLLYVENMDSYMAAYVADPTYETGDDLLDAFIKYCSGTILYTDGTDTIEKYTCHGTYDHVTSIQRESGKYETFDEIYDILETRPTTITTTDPATGATTTSTANEFAYENTQEIFNYIGYDIPKDFALYEFIQAIFKGEKDNLYLYEEVVTLAERLVESNVERYVYLPKLKKLDISYNADLGGIDRISELTSLRELYANANYLGNIQSVDWNALKYLRKLGLAYNYITDITPLEVLNHIVDLDVSHNLLAGEFKFNFANAQKTLQNFDLSYNQLTDITRIQEFLDLVTYGNYANFLAQPYTLNINLNNQNIIVEVEDPINLKQFPSTVNIELPKIFTQLLAIDTDRTSFGITSEDGRIESEGTYVTVSTLTEGDKVARANVIAKSGNGTPVETCVGNGTTVTIKYKVVAPKVTSVTVTPGEDVVVKPGEALQFSATVEGENLTTTKVVWEVRNAQSADTKISEDGTLTIGADETAENLIIIAKSEEDGSVVETITISTVELPPEAPEGTEPEAPEGTEPEAPEGTEPEAPEGTEPETPEGTEPEAPEGTEPEAPEGTEPETPEGTEPEAPEGTEPETPEGTEPETPEGTEPETPEGTEPEAPEGTEPEVDVIDTATLGYKAGEEYLTNVKAKTSIENFTRVLLNGKEYSVVVKKENKDGNMEVVTEGIVGTGMYVQVQDENGNVIKDKDGHLVVYEIVVKGDVNGDGLANSLDSIMMKAYRNEVITLSGSAQVAADINEDGSVNISDSKLLLYHRAEVTGYNLNY